MSAEPFVGEIQIYGFSFAPRSWAFCDGTILSIANNQSLFALLGVTYGGDGRSSFALPDLRGRTPIHKGHGPGLSNYDIGQKSGDEIYQLNELNLPTHTHTATFTPLANVETATLSVSTDTATLNTPVKGAYLAVNTNGRNAGIDMYREDAGAGTVEIGGMNTVNSGGTIVNDPVGGGTSFPLVQPYTTLNYCIAMQGIFPSRS